MAELTADEALDRLRTIVDEGIGMQPVLGWEDLLTIVERHMFTQRVELQTLRDQYDRHVARHIEEKRQLRALPTGSADK